MPTKPFIYYFIIGICILTFTACDTELNTHTVTITPQETAIMKIADYAGNGDLKPTVDDYIRAGVSGVNTNNIDEINTIIRAYASNDIDSSEKIQLLIKDTETPILTLYGDNPLHMVLGEYYTEHGASAIDIRDGNLTKNINIIGTVDADTVGEYTVRYSISDSAGNSASINRIVSVKLPEDISLPMLTLYGDDPLTITQGDDYIEYGASAIDKKDGNLTADIVIIENVDTETVGDYLVNYNVSNSAGNNADINRTVHVILPEDTTPPVISILGANPLELTEGDSYTDAGATATDDRDDEIDVETLNSIDSNILGIQIVTYSATDRAGNSAIATRTVNVVLGPDTTAPVITLNGETDMNVGIDQPYMEPKAVADDDRDGNITSSIIISGAVDTTILGTYTITYTAYDDAGNEASKTRTVHVVRFTRNDTSHIVIDHIDGRMWQDDTAAKSIRLNWEDSNLYCNDLKLGGYTDWTLPELTVLKSIVDTKRYPSIDHAFSNILFDNYWSSTLKAGSSFKAWTIRFYYGDEVWVSKRDSYSIRCVRNKL